MFFGFRLVEVGILSGCSILLKIIKKDGGDAPQVKITMAAILALNMKGCRREDW